MTDLLSDGMEKVVCRAAAKVPIVKCWDPELQLAADLNVNNTLALQNTRMIKTYVQLDDRIRPLAKIIKYWTKRRILNDAGECHRSSILDQTTDIHLSLRWHDQLVYLDMYDHQFPATTESSDPAIPTKHIWMSSTVRNR
jgi:hypothetical protein